MAAADETWKTTVFVGRLPPGTSEDELATKFSTVGTVKSVTPASVAKTSFLIEMSTEAEAGAAAEDLAGVPLREGDERGMRVNLARPPLERVSNPRGVFVRNLPRSATEESVKAIFAGVGTIETFELIPRRGAAEILFTEEAALAPALAKNGGVMDDRTFYVEQQQKAVNPPKRTRRRKRAGGAAAPAAGGDSAPREGREVSANPRKVRVSGLAEGTTEEDVTAFAAGAGAVQRVKVVDSTVTGLHAFITFEDAEAATAAVETLTGTALNAAEVTVEADKGRVRRRNRRRRDAEDTAGDDAPAAPAVADPKRLWVGNVPSGIEKDAIIEAFAQFGEVARFQRRNPTIRYCYVTFSTEEAAAAALAATVELQGDVLKLEASSASKPRNSRPGRRAVPTEE